MTAWRSHLLAFVGLGVFALVLGFRLVIEPAGLLVGPQFGGRNDLTAGFLAYRSFPTDVLSHDGQVPLWNPYLLGGTPWLGNPQSGLFYPPNLAFFLNVGPWLAGWLMLAHLWWGGVGVYTLARQLGWSWASGLLGGFAYLAAPYLMAHTGEGHFNQICVASWIPWAFFAYERLRTGEKWSAPMLAVVLALGFFCGHVQELYYFVLFLSLLLITDLCAFRPAIPRKRILLIWLGAGALSAGLVAVEFLPEFLVSRQAVRSGGLSLEQAAAISLAPLSFRQLVDPFALGGPENYQGPGLFFWETLFHFGWAASLLAIGGIIAGWKNPRVWRYGLLGVFAALIAFGESTPVFGGLFQWVPGFSLFRAPARGLFFSSFVIAILAASGTDGMIGRLRKTRAIALVLILILVMAGETVRNSGRMLAVVPSENLRQQSPIVQYLAEHAGMNRVLVHQDLLTEREAWPARIFKVHGYDPVPLTRAAILFDALVPNQSPAGEVVGLKPALPQRFRPTLIELLGVKYAVVPADLPLPKAGWKIVHSGEAPRDVTLSGEPVKMLGYRILERESTFPRAFVLGPARVLNASEAFSRQLATLSPRQEVLVHEDVLPQGDRQLFQAAEILEYSPNRIVIEATLEHPGYLVLTDIYAPGWIARVNGERQMVVPINVAFRGVPLPKGTHRVELVYSPPGWKIGIAISGLSVFLLMGVIARGFVSPSESKERPFGFERKAKLDAN